MRTKHATKIIKPVIFLLAVLCRQMPCYAQLPIKPARTIEFTTNEGSYMDVSVSPDGKQLVFSLLGDLYIVPSTGGQAKQLTRGVAMNVKPVWSPDGTMIAYISDAFGILHLTIRNADGSFQKTFGARNDRLDAGDFSDVIHSLCQITWSSNCAYIAVGDGSKSSVIYQVGNGVHLAQVETGNVLSLNGAGRPVVWEVQIYGKGHRKEIRRKRRPGDADTLLCSINDKCKTNILSPDGSKLALVTDSAGQKSLVVNDLATHTERTLVPALLTSGKDYISWVNGTYSPPWGISFSPGGHYIYIGYQGKIHRVGVTDGSNEIVPFKADVKVDMGALNYNKFPVSQQPFRIHYARNANLSPDNKHVAFAALDRIYVKDLPNGKPHILVKQNINQFQPIYSPDGKWIAYVSWSDTIGGFLWKAPAKGGKPIQLTQVAGQYQRPCWSPDGKQIAVIKGGYAKSGAEFKGYASGSGLPTLGEMINSGIGRLELINVKNHSITPVADSVPTDNALSFTKDGLKIAYQPYYVSQPDKYLVSRYLNGSHQQILAKGIVPNGYVKDRVLSPDGHYIAYSMNEDIYVKPVDSVSGLPLLYDPLLVGHYLRIAKGVDPYWSRDSRALYWNFGSKFYRMSLKKILAGKVKPEHYVAVLQQQLITDLSLKPDLVADLSFMVPSSYAKGVVALRNARILTMQGSRVIEKGTIIISNGRFALIGGQNIPIPRIAKVIDLTGKTIMPGIIDLHLHMSKTIDVYPQQNWPYLANLAYGVTTARDPSSTYDSYGLGELLRTGQMIGPRLYTSGPPARFDDGISEMASYDEALSLSSKRAELNGTFTKQYGLPNRLQREWLLLASKTNGLNMTNEGGASPLDDIAMLKDGDPGIEHNPYWGDVYKDVITLFARSGTFFTPTLQVARSDEPGEAYLDQKYWHQPDAKLRRFTDADRLKRIMERKALDTVVPDFLSFTRVDARLRHAGAKVTLGGHGDDEGIGSHNELWALQMGGVTNMEALQAATIMGAEGLGIQKDLGSIAVGKIADLIILNSNPLDDIHNSRDIKYVMKDGILYDGDTLDEIWPIKKKCPEWRLKTNSKN